MKRSARTEPAAFFFQSEQQQPRTWKKKAATVRSACPSRSVASRATPKLYIGGVLAMPPYAPVENRCGFVFEVRGCRFSDFKNETADSQTGTKLAYPPGLDPIIPCSGELAV